MTIGGESETKSTSLRRLFEVDSPTSGAEVYVLVIRHVRSFDEISFNAVTMAIEISEDASSDTPSRVSGRKPMAFQTTLISSVSLSAVVDVDSSKENCVLI